MHMHMRNFKQHNSSKTIDVDVEDETSWIY